MDDKNRVHIDEVNKLQEEVVALRNKVSSKFNNREMSLVTTKLQEAEHWLAAYREVLKNK